VLGCPLDFSRISVADAHRRNIAPVRLTSGELIVAVGDPADGLLLAWIAARPGGAPMRWALSDAAWIRTALASAPAEPEDDSNRPAFQQAGATRLDSPVVDFVDQLVEAAWRDGASDIHLETRRDGLAIKLRLDGVLVSGGRWAGAEPPSEVLSRIKVLAELDIAERRVPQDGRFTRTLDGREVDFRVSVMPNSYGEDAVLRILDKRHLLQAGDQIALDALGFSGIRLQRMRALARRPHGMLLVTGPTGSGKTTTLYAAISETLNGREKVITIEDPIEYELPGVLQIPVNEKKGLTFARGLRSILRHDPDTIFVGEIRDSETADIAVQSALTGHLVFTTVHANDLFDVIGRFVHMRVDLFSLMSALNGVVSQRLVRCLCPHCARPAEHIRNEIASLGWPAEATASPREAAGCDRCRGTGYAGRTVVSEVLLVDDALRELVVRRSTVGDMKAHVAAASGVSMRQEALQLVADGRTSLEEIRRVLALE
jgi:general secretion pathway protein E